MNHATTARPASPIKFYCFSISGHSHRVELFLSLLRLPVELIHVDLANAAHKTPEFLRMNPFGQIPVIQDGDITIADSNAILVYLAKRYDNGTWLPEDAVKAAEVQRWLSVAAGLVAYGPAAARLVKVFNASFNLDEVQGRAYRLFDIMEPLLQRSHFLVGNQATLADIANYSYIAHAPEGGVSLESYPNIRAWLARVEALPGFIGMPKTQVA